MSLRSLCFELEQSEETEGSVWFCACIVTIVSGTSNISGCVQLLPETESIPVNEEETKIYLKSLIHFVRPLQYGKLITR